MTLSLGAWIFLRYLKMICDDVLSNLLSDAARSNQFRNEDKFLFVLELSRLSHFKIYHVEDRLVHQVLDVAE